MSACQPTVQGNTTFSQRVSLIKEKRFLTLGVSLVKETR